MLKRLFVHMSKVKIKGSGLLLLKNTSLELTESKDLVKVIIEKKHDLLIFRFIPKVREDLIISSCKIDISKEPDLVPKRGLISFLIKLGLKYRYARLIGPERCIFGKCIIHITSKEFILILESPNDKFFTLNDFINELEKSELDVTITKDVSEFKFL